MQNFQDTSETTVLRNIESTKELVYTYDQVSLQYEYNGIIIQSPYTVFDTFQDLYEDILMEIEIEERHFYRPERVSLELYGTSELWYLVLRANNMQHHSEFRNSVIKVIIPTQIEKVTDLVDTFREILDENHMKQVSITDLTLRPVII